MESSKKIAEKKLLAYRVKKWGTRYTLYSINIVEWEVHVGINPGVDRAELIVQRKKIAHW